jgi:hypothetical protein
MATYSVDNLEPKQVRPAQMVIEDLRLDSGLFRGTHAELEGHLHKGSIVGYLNKYIGGDDNRKAVLGFVFKGQPGLLMSTKELNPGEWFALARWIDAYHSDEDGKWHVSERFEIEALLVLAETRRLSMDSASPMLNEALAMGGEIKSVTSTAKPEDNTPWQKSRFNRLLFK